MEFRAVKNNGVHYCVESLVTTAWLILRFQTKELAFRYEGSYGYTK
jgi:hypothetical protein